MTLPYSIVYAQGVGIIPRHKHQHVEFMGTTFKYVPCNKKPKKYIICDLLYRRFAQLFSVESPSLSRSRIAFT